MPGALKEKADRIIEKALLAVDPARAVRRALVREGDSLRAGGRVLDLNAYRRVVVVGAGKAGAPMARAAEEVLGDRISQGLVVVKYGHGGTTEKVEILEAGHPVPDENGVQAARRIAALVKENAAPDTLFLALISGGGSALMPSPAGDLSLADKQAVTRLLLKSGADIGEINAIRKHLSGLKGGNLARLAAPGALLALLISDVVGDRLDVIASGPTVPDLSTWRDCREIMARRDIWDQVPPPVRDRIEAGLSGGLPENPGPGDPAFENTSTLIVSSNRLSLEAAALAAREEGLTPLVLSSSIEGETADIARMHSALAREAAETGRPAEPPCCLISGGETTVTLGEATGLGGRNQEFALAAALDLEGWRDILAVSLGTDGTDGPTDAAGARADGTTAARAREMGMDPRDYLTRHDAYHFFEALGDLIITGPTRTNVMDIRLMLVGSRMN